MSKLLILIAIFTLFGFEGCLREQYPQGKRIYNAYCLQCHMEDGSGLGDLYPSLSDSEFLTMRMNELSCLIRNGRQSSQLVTVYMPAHKSLKDAELANLINYISYQWGNKKKIQMRDVQEDLKACP